MNSFQGIVSSIMEQKRSPFNVLVLLVNFSKVTSTQKAAAHNKERRQGAETHLWQDENV